MMSIKEYAEHCGISIPTIWRRIATGAILPSKMENGTLAIDETKYGKITKSNRGRKKKVQA